jgi:hypothetical protein
VAPASRLSRWKRGRRFSRSLAERPKIAGETRAPRDAPSPYETGLIFRVTENYALDARSPASLAVIVISALSRREMGHPALASCAAFSNAAAFAPGIFAVTSR